MEQGVAKLLHRWSGWPGAWCLDCGVPDPVEQCLAEGDLDYVCVKCGEAWPQMDCPKGGEHQVRMVLCAKHEVRTCQYPGARMFDPYFQKEDENV